MITNGIILADKNIGQTSFQFLGTIKRKLNTKRVGHAGTLDKFASGLMIVLVGRATKLNALFSGLDKSYIATMSFGVETDTLDPEGQVIKTANLPDLNQIEKVLPTFLGTINQIPPAYSAIHINGKRAYERVRSGEKVEPPIRKIDIKSLKAVSYNEETLKFEVFCSKGTYVRSLARDIAYSLNSCGHLEHLRRTSIGPFNLEDYKQNVLIGSDELLKKLFNWDSLYLKPDYYSYTKDGKVLYPEYFIEPPEIEGTYFLYREDDVFVGIVEFANRSLKYYYLERLD
ncbi:tRNA pseudouridine(55) synthase TruB [Spirochaeta cellobiosiphila]|uniref:tRNA pseudouridine(55) synthase TruB n=1 Tax=Spirochaeta cellobiosiphila TaxID=504483 RepID=UPI000429D440|nr:tRNA pseudouridine(55) synthase TruB [Spirochaeta cellobiosiphila]